MQDSTRWLLYIIGYFLIEVLYMRLARRLEITDNPNARSSHTKSTIRGGGIIFPLAAFIGYISTSPNWIAFCGSLVIISVLSFLDDIRSLASLLRLGIQSISVGWLLFSTNQQLSLGMLIIVCLLMICIINGYNFMDGINGITALYSIVTVACLFWVNQHMVSLFDELLFESILAALFVFSFFNLRKKAVCFAGDVGSISIAFTICFILFMLIIRTDYFYWILLIGVYGIDTTFTFLCRILRREKVLEAHRSHFYQYLSNEKKMSHILVSAVYAFAQLNLNFVVIYSYRKSLVAMPIFFLLAFLLIYITFRLRFEGKKRLFQVY